MSKELKSTPKSQVAAIFTLMLLPAKHPMTPLLKLYGCAQGIAGRET